MLLACLSFASCLRPSADTEYCTSNNDSHRASGMDNSPFSLLPAELISKIFEDCLPEDKPSFNPHDAPLVLTHVCHNWRVIASHTPHLWSHILIPRRKFAPAHVDELVDLWLVRSGSTPLSIDIGIFDQDARLARGRQLQREDAMVHILQRILSLVAPHRARIQSLWGVFPPSLTQDVGVSEMTNAERLFYYGTPKQNSLRLSDSDDSPSSPVKLDLGDKKPSLRILSVCDCNVNIDSVLLQTGLDRKSTRLNSSHSGESRMPSSA